MKKILVSNPTFKATAQPITERVKTFEDACQVLGITGDILNGEISDELDSDLDSIKAYTKLIIIIRALNEGWKPNWDNSNEYKYYPYFQMTSKGFVLCDVSYGYSYSYVGSRLCFKSNALAEYAANQFADLYKSFYTL